MSKYWEYRAALRQAAYDRANNDLEQEKQANIAAQAAAFGAMAIPEGEEE